MLKQILPHLRVAGFETINVVDDQATLGCFGESYSERAAKFRFLLWLEGGVVFSSKDILTKRMFFASVIERALVLFPNTF